MSDTAEVRKSEFFTSSNAVSSVPDSEYARVEPYVEILECMSRLTYQSIYVIDYWKKNFLYVSDNPLFLCGRTREEVLTKGYDFYFEVCDRSELAVLVEINEAAFRFYNRLPGLRRGRCGWPCARCRWPRTARSFRPVSSARTAPKCGTIVLRAAAGRRVRRTC